MMNLSVRNVFYIFGLFGFWNCVPHTSHTIWVRTRGAKLYMKTMGHKLSKVINIQRFIVRPAQQDCGDCNKLTKDIIATTSSVNSPTWTEASLLVLFYWAKWDKVRVCCLTQREDNRVIVPLSTAPLIVSTSPSSIIAAAHYLTYSSLVITAAPAAPQPPTTRRGRPTTQCTQQLGRESSWNCIHSWLTDPTAVCVHVRIG